MSCKFESDGFVYQVEVDEDGDLVFLNCDIDSDIAEHDLGGEPTPAMIFRETYYTYHPDDYPSFAATEISNGLRDWTTVFGASWELPKDWQLCLTALWGGSIALFAMASRRGLSVAERYDLAESIGTWDAWSYLAGEGEGLTEPQRWEIVDQLPPNWKGQLAMSHTSSFDKDERVEIIQGAEDIQKVYFIERSSKLWLTGSQEKQILLSMMDMDLLTDALIDASCMSAQDVLDVALDRLDEEHLETLAHEDPRLRDLIHERLYGE